MRLIALALSAGLLAQASFTEVHCNGSVRPGLVRMSGRVLTYEGLPVPYIRVAGCDPNMDANAPDMRYLVGLTVSDANGFFELWSHPNYPLRVYPICRQLWTDEAIDLGIWEGRALWIQPD